MKKIFFIAALPALAIILTGCFKKPAPLPTPTDNQPMQETPLNEAPAVIGTAYDINLEKSTIAWTGRKTMVKSEHFGKVNIKTGQILLDGTQLTGGNFTVDMPTIISEDAKGKSKEALETHIKGPDFFDVAQYPEANLLIKSVAATNAGTSTTSSLYSITADLTIKGVTNTVNFPVEASVNNGLWLGTASFNIDRTLWGIQYNSGKFFSDLGDKVIDDMIDFKITIAVELPVTDNQSATTTQTTVEDVPVNQVTQ